MARRHLDPERIAVVAVGPAEILEPQLEGVGPVTVWSPEGEPRAAHESGACSFSGSVD